jgi:hypothetical protein
MASLPATAFWSDRTPRSAAGPAIVTANRVQDRGRAAARRGCYPRRAAAARARPGPSRVAAWRQAQGPSSGGPAAGRWRGGAGTARREVPRASACDNPPSPGVRASNAMLNRRGRLGRRRFQQTDMAARSAAADRSATHCDGSGLLPQALVRHDSRQRCNAVQRRCGICYAASGRILLHFTTSARAAPFSGG